MGGEQDRVEPVVDSDLLSDVVIRITLKMVTRWNNALGKSSLRYVALLLILKIINKESNQEYFDVLHKKLTVSLRSTGRWRRF